jgi:hypothetical protein
LEHALLTYSAGKPDEWEQHLSKTVFSMNATRQTTTGYSPFYLLIGQHARLPLAAAAGALGIAIEAHDVVKSALPERVAALSKAQREVVNIAAAQAKQAQTHAKRVWGEVLPALPVASSLVCMNEPGKGKGVEGPYKLLRIEKASATLQEGAGKEWNCNFSGQKVSNNAAASPPAAPPPCHAARTPEGGSVQQWMDPTQNKRPPILQRDDGHSWRDTNVTTKKGDPSPETYKASNYAAIHLLRTRFYGPTSDSKWRGQQKGKVQRPVWEATEADELYFQQGLIPPGQFLHYKPATDSRGQQRWLHKARFEGLYHLVSQDRIEPPHIAAPAAAPTKTVVVKPASNVKIGKDSEQGWPSLYGVEDDGQSSLLSMS